MRKNTPQLRVSDLWNWPSLLTGVRLGIAVGFPFLMHRPMWAFAAYLFALLTDILDGVVARWLGVETQAGAVADGWVDKILHVNAAWAMWIHGLIPGVWMLLLFTREIIQFPQILWLAGPFCRGSVCPQKALLSGRLTSTFLATTFVAAFMGWVSVGWVAASLTGLAGSWAALEYFSREYAQGYGRAG